MPADSQQVSADSERPAGDRFTDTARILSQVMGRMDCDGLDANRAQSAEISPKIPGKYPELTKSTPDLTKRPTRYHPQEGNETFKINKKAPAQEELFVLKLTQIGSKHHLDQSEIVTVMMAKAIDAGVNNPVAKAITTEGPAGPVTITALKSTLEAVFDTAEFVVKTKARAGSADEFSEFVKVDLDMDIWALSATTSA